MYPFIVRGASLLGVDTVLTPITERREVWTEMAASFPAGLVDGMAAGEVGLDGLAPVLEAILGGHVRGRMLVRPG